MDAILCPYCRQRPATGSTMMMRLPTCAVCEDTVALEDESAIDFVLSAGGTKEMANDGRVRDCVIEAEASDRESEHDA